MLSVKLGDPVFLNLQLSSGSAGKFVSVTLRDDNGTVLPGSPVSLTDNGAGFYSSKSFLMPNRAIVVATYRVFENAGLTVRSETDGDTIDLFVLDYVAAAISVGVDGITGIITQVETTIVGVLESSDISGQIETVSETITGTLFTGSITGEISDNIFTGIICK